MLIDLNQQRPQRFSAEVCVVGTGAAGLTLASAFLQSGVSVMLLESGGFEHEQRAERLNRCETDRLLFDGAHSGRKRVFGGSTTCWGGQLLPLDPIDFNKRAWVDHSGWPIGAEEVAPYYRQALRFAGSDELDFDSDICQALGVDSPLDESTFRYYFSKWAPRPNFREIVGDDLEESDHVRVFLHANVTEIELGRGRDHVKEVRARNFDDEGFVFDAQVVVLATGGIETARLLLSNRDQVPGGIGNGHDLVGRFFHDHPSLLVGTVRTREPARFRKLFYEAKIDDLKVTPRLSLRPAAQEAYELLNVAAYMSFAYPRTVLRRAMLVNLARRVRVERQGARHLVEAASSSLGSTMKLHRDRRMVAEDARFTLTVTTEQEPCADSRITLANSLDRFGVPRARIRWHNTDKTWETIVRFSKLLQEEFRRVGLGEVELFAGVRADRAYWRIFPHDLYHHMGATRMGPSPSTGVVDENCRVFGAKNLYIASSSVFPTGGHSNCTLTIMALAFRLARHLGVSARSLDSAQALTRPGLPDPKGR